MLKYDPLIAPDSQQWLALGELERIQCVQTYHEELGEDLPNPRLHAVFHVVVENQLTMPEDLPVQETLDRLMDESLDRHDAIHAIGSVLVEQMYGIIKNKSAPKGDPNKAYIGKLKRLTAKSWRKSS